ncbi:MAG: acetyl-CoA acetyltransferase [Acidimicrobiales bacterium]
MPPNPRLPVLIGGGQVNQRDADGLEPVDLLVEAARRGAADTGVADPSGLLAALDTISVVQLLSWRYRDPAALVADRVGARPRSTVYSAAGGNMPQKLVNRAAREIQEGRADLVLVGGAEAWRARMALRADNGRRPDWTVQPDDVTPTVVVGRDTPLAHPAEMARGLMMPVQHYPLFESALRAAAGRSVEDHNFRIAALWSRFSAVAATNPDAWIRRRYSAEEIRTPGPDNRMIGFPYPKLMNSNNSVEQGAAVILCSVERARALGVPGDRWVFPWAGTDLQDTDFVSHRPTLAGSPAIRVGGKGGAGVGRAGGGRRGPRRPLFLLPSAVQVAATELGLPRPPLTVTGGLSFAGGPWNNYVTHALATMTRVLREDAGTVGLCTANGGFLTKHAFGVYSTAPPPSGSFRWSSPQGEVDSAGTVALREEWDGPVTVEAATVMHARTGEPENGIVAVRTPEGERAWGTSGDLDTLAAIETTETVGAGGHLSGDGTFLLA